MSLKKNPLLASLIILSGCSSITPPQQVYQYPIVVDEYLMTRPPELELISKSVIAENNIKLALPVIIQNYKAYFATKEKLIGLQNIITTYNQEIKND